MGAILVVIMSGRTLRITRAGAFSHTRTHWNVSTGLLNERAGSVHRRCGSATAACRPVHHARRLARRHRQRRSPRPFLIIIIITAREISQSFQRSNSSRRHLKAFLEITDVEMAESFDTSAERVGGMFEK